jgi:Mor family transcriptional regulator
MPAQTHGFFGGTSIYIPRCNALVNRLRQRNIIKDFSHSTRRGSSSTAAVANLARRHGISDRRVWQILKKENSVPPHARLILRLGDSAQQASRQSDGNG